MSVSVLDPEEAHRLVSVSGTARLELEGADEVIDHLAKKYLGVESIPPDPGRGRVTVRVNAGDVIFSAEAERCGRVERAVPRPIRHVGDPVLHRPASRSTRSTRTSGHRVVHDMFASRYAADGVGLAANQIGVPLRVFV
ncbi:peptide deformylase [Streptosporangium vulgare]|uniref:peptide deformylase n=1 Tax=Streptosporangium vulgare TaxID=46190 RepID=UPI0031DBA853